MLISTIYLTRKCPMNCAYCSIKDNSFPNELSLEEWKKAFLVLKKIGVDFNLIIGNEVLMLGDDLVELVKFLNEENIAYGMYTTFPEPQFSKYKDKLIDVNIKNLSFGCDTLAGTDSVAVKSRRGLKNIQEMIEKGLPDYHATVTVSKRNLDEVEDIVDKITDAGVWMALNAILWNKDGKYDFMPPKEAMGDYIIDDKEKYEKVMRNIQKKVENGDVKIQNDPEYFEAMIKHGRDMSWHCENPLVITVDADGSLRTCIYRKGDNVSNMTVFDLDDEKKYEEYKKLWKIDSDDCPGCMWGCFWQAEHYHKNNDEEFGKKSFQSHASKYYKEDK